MKRISRIHYLSFFFIALSSCALSIFTLYSQSIRLDESQSIWMATKSLAGMLKLVSEDVHVPLYYTLLHFWLQFLGTDVFVARLFSIIFFLLTLPVLYTMVKESSNEKVALTTVLLFSFSPFVIWYSNEARMYTLFTFVTSLNHLYFMRLEKSNGKVGKLGYFISAVLGIYTHYFFNLLLATQALFVFTKLFTTRAELPQDERVFFHTTQAVKRFVLTYFGILITAGLTLLPWLMYVVMSGKISNSSPLIPPPTSYNVFQVFVNFLFGFQSNGIQAAIVSLWPVAVLMLFFVFTHRRKIDIYKPEYVALVTFLPIALVFFLSYIRPLFLSRYLIFVTPTLFFIVAWMMLSYTKKISTVLIGGFTALMIGLLLYQNVSLKTPVKEDYQEVDAYLNEHVTPRDIVAISAPFTIYPIEYYYKGKAKLTTVPEWERYQEGVIPPYSDALLIEQIKKYEKQYTHIYFVLSYDQGYEAKIIKYMDDHYNKEFQKTFSPGLQIRQYTLRYDILPPKE